MWGQTGRPPFLAARAASTAEAGFRFCGALRHGLSRALPEQRQDQDQRQRRRTGVSDPHGRLSLIDGVIRGEQQVPHRAFSPVRNDMPWLRAVLPQRLKPGSVFGGALAARLKAAPFQGTPLCGTA
jgi:hypothetical protein